MPRGKHGNHRRGSSHPRWNGGRIKSSEGYTKIRVGVGHPLADPNGYAYEHLIVWCAAGNPRPRENEIIHHSNRDRTDNRIENLELMDRGEHNAHHNKDRRRDESGRFVGKKAAGRELDGQTHSEFPVVEEAAL